MTSRTVSERFENFIQYEPNTGCWLWSGGGTSDGYGSFKVGTSTVLSHRFSYELHVGSIPNGMHVCHKCDVRNCVNPDHLFLGTNSDNVADKVSKGRQAKHKLTDEQALLIRDDPRPYPEIAAEFGVSKSLICRIKKGEVWGRL